MISVPKTYECVSFDVFDTVLVRSYLKPVDVFYQVERLLAIRGYDSNGFSNARISAELEARRGKHFKSEVSLDQIYEYLIQDLAYSSEFANEAKSIELDVERLCLGPIVGMREAISSLRALGKKIVFTSDIYLPESFLKDILIKCELYKDPDVLIVSSTHGLMKATGDLYSQLKKIHNNSLNQICHVGDNFESDVRQAESVGIRSVYFRGSEPNRYERTESKSWILRTFLGASRFVRLSHSPERKKNPTIWDTTANISAPLIFAFVNWCILSSIKKNIKVIYFFARDGEILYKLSKKIIERYYASKIEARYLYVSRQALLFPSMNDLSENEFSWIFARTSLLTVEIVLNRLCFTYSDFENDLRDFGFDNKNINLNDDNIYLLKKILIKNKKLILTKVKKYRLNVLGYLVQEGLINHDVISVVDVGWGGSLQKAIGSILRSEGYKIIIKGHYFGVTRRPESNSFDSMHAWFTDCDNPNPLTQEVYIVPMIELFTAASHGGTNGYDKSNVGYIPVLRSPHNLKALSWGVLVQQAAMEYFTSTILDMLDCSDVEFLSEQVLPTLMCNLRQFMLEPSYDEAKSYCNFEDAEDQTEAYFRSLGKPYDYHELKRYFKEDFMHHHNEWRQGSLRLTDQRLVNFVYKNMIKDI